MPSPVNFAINVAMLGALYALVAMGFTLIFGVGGVLNLAHGAAITLGGYAAYVLSSATGSILVGALGAMVVPALFSVVLYKGLIRPARENPVVVLILTLVSGLVVEQVILAVFGGTPLVVSDLVSGQVRIAGSGVEANRLLAFVLSWVAIGGLFYFVTRTRRGKAILATSMSEKGAALVGIDADGVYTYTWALAGALAGVAGLFLASFRAASPVMGRAPLLLAFSIVVLGGLGSIKGSVIGAYLISFLEQGMVTYGSTRLSGVAALVVLVLVLLVKPEGLYGRELAEE